MYLDMKHSYFKTLGVSVSHMLYSDMHLARTLPDTHVWQLNGLNLKRHMHTTQYV